MRLSRTSRRYAEALCGAAGGANRIDAVLADLSQIAALIRESSSRDLTHPMTLKLLRFLAEIIEAMTTSHDERRGILKVRLTSAFPMDAETVTAIAERIQRNRRKPVAVAVAVDPGLLGGFRFQIGDAVYDHSLRGALECLRENLIRA
ncbi:MAG: F0F1 ATP synthase subunit delta [Verrucomicrobiota bacterium]|nr:F0F1 ATP synthase subunit delta [Verrucomicrobiota bacterium]